MTSQNAQTMYVELKGHHVLTKIFAMQGIFNLTVDIF